MAINSRLKILALISMFLCGLFSLPAQTAGYFLDPDSEEPRFIQRLAWSGGMYSLHCEVIIEKEEDGRYVNYLSKFTTGNYLDLSLSPGNYRFRVIPYDVLNKPSKGTQWESFKVFNAVKPELYHPKEKTNYIKNERGFIFVFSGKNLEPDAMIYFVGSDGEHIIPVDIIRNDDGSNVSLVFDKNQLSGGEYEVFVINPGGLQATLSGINFESSKKELDRLFYIFGVSLMTVYPAYGDGLGGDRDLYNISARISMNSRIFLNNYIGVEFSVTKCMDNIDCKLSGYTAGYNLLYINWLPNRKAACNFRIGVGFSTQPLDCIYSNIGISFLFRVVDHLGVELGVNYINLFNGNYGGGIQPWIGLSLIF